MKVNSEGFSLIEMLVVVGLIVLITGLAMPTVSSYFQLSLSSATRDIATVIKESYNAAVITGKVYRIVYDLKTSTYWVESGPADVLLDTKETKEREDRRRKFSSNSNTAPRSPFSMDTTITRKKKSLPQGASFEDVVTQQSPDPIIEGMAYTHFFPHGLAEQTIVHLQDQSKHHMSLVITPVLGNTDQYDRYVKGAEVFAK